MFCTDGSNTSIAGSRGVLSVITDVESSSSETAGLIAKKRKVITVSDIIDADEPGIITVFRSV